MLTLQKQWEMVLLLVQVIPVALGHILQMEGLQKDRTVI